MSTNEDTLDKLIVKRDYSRHTPSVRDKERELSKRLGMSLKEDIGMSTEDAFELEAMKGTMILQSAFSIGNASILCIVVICLLCLLGAICYRCNKGR